MELTGSHDGRRQPSAEPDIHVKRKRSASAASIKSERDREDSPLFEPQGRNQAAQAQGQEFNFDEEAAAMPDSITEASTNTNTVKQPSAIDGRHPMDVAKRITMESNAVSAPYSLSQIELDEAGCVPAYDVKSEQQPRLGAFCPSFKLAEKAATQACDIVIDTFDELKKLGYQNQEIAVVCGEAGLEACRVPSVFYPAVGPVAVLGPAGSGKSSAINSILSQTKAAFEHDGDDRGTYVPHEYCSAQADQTSPYRLVAIYYSEDEVERSVNRSFRDIKAALMDTEDDASDENEDKALQQKCDTALGFFTDLLCSRKQFRTTSDTETYFDGRVDKGDTDEDICADLIAWIDEFLASRPEYVDEKETYDIQNENELHRVFKSVSRPSKVQGQQQPSPWPILQKVVVHHSVPVLNAGVVIADTPGFNDQNLAVVDNTTRYLKQAGTILVFLSYKRIQQNSPLDKLLRQCVALGKMGSIRLVVTMIDDMKLHTDDEKEDLPADEKARLEKADATVRSLTNEIKDTDTAKRAARGRDNDQFAELDSRLSELCIQKTQAVVSQRQTSIEIRCRAIAKSLVSRLKNIEKSKYAPDLPITFISNTQYQRHVAGYEPLSAPSLDLQGTGIPSLRQELFSVPTYGKLENLKGLAENRLPNVLLGVEGILTKSKLERKAEVGRTIKIALRKYEDPAAEMSDRIMDAFAHRVSNVVQGNISSWRDDAQKLLTRWADEIPGPTFKAVCVREGNWEGHKKFGDVKWNEELLDVFADKLNEGFINLIRDNLEVFRKDFAVEVKNTFSKMRTDVETSKDAQGKVLLPFFKFVDGMVRDVVTEMNTKFDALKHSIGQIRHQTVLDSTHNYVTMAMRGAYGEAALLNSKSMGPLNGIPSQAGRKRKRRAKKSPLHGARVQILAVKLRGEGDRVCVFTHVNELAYHDLELTLKDWADQCNAIMKRSTDRILEDFNTRFVDNEEVVEDDPVAIAKLKEAVDEAIRVTKMMQSYVAECEAYEQRG